jgi:predicted transcriptional regulator
MNDIAQGRQHLRPFAIEASLEAAVERCELRHRPFDHIQMENVLEPGAYEDLVAALPDRRYFHELSHRDAMRSDGSSTRLRMYLYPELLWRLPGPQRTAWTAVGRALCSPRLQSAFKRKFSRSLERRFGKPVERIGLYPVPILLRDQPGYRIGIHSDASQKAITVQYYLPRDRSRDHLGTIFHEGESGELAARTTHIPFLPASGYAFPVSLQKSWHSAPTTTDADGERISMMVTFYVADDLKSRLNRLATRAGLLVGNHPRS